MLGGLNWLWEASVPRHLVARVSSCGDGTVNPPIGHRRTTLKNLNPTPS